MKSRAIYETGSLAIVLCLLPMPASNDCLAQNCVPNPGSGPDICLSWAIGGGAPQSPEHFVVNFSDPAFPDIELKRGTTWTIWSVDAANPGGIGDIGTITSPHPEVFVVRVKSGTGPGARNMKSINLNPTNGNSAKLLSSKITGSVEGDIFVGSGGNLSVSDLDLEVPGNVGGSITAGLVLHGLIVGGEVGGNVSLEGLGFADSVIDIGSIADGTVFSIQPFAFGVGQTVRIADGVPPKSTIRLQGIGPNGLLELGYAQCAGSGCGDVEGNVTLVRNFYFGGEVKIWHDLTGALNIEEGDIPGGGIVNVVGDVGSLGEVTITGTFDSVYSDINVTGAVDGDITIAGPSVGNIDIGGDVSGTIKIMGDMDPGTRIQVGGRLGRGRVLVEGLCDGDISIANGTGKVSLIHMTGGLDSAGSVTVNSPNNNSNANGDIYIGPTKWAQMPNVTFDGAIQINKGSGGGDLNGDITVVGCHATADDLAICVEGTANGAVAIIQAGCANQVGWCCSPPCQ